ncbi:hypothetical protein P692DRAFT_201810116 [Suillus brevipes Sb2]|nr:hypothetical protein P692DRAFT_201810116 [Suillus brevipes Sb2]
MTHQHLNLQLPGLPVPQASSSGTSAPVGPQHPSDSAEPPEELGHGTAHAKAAATRQSARLASVGADTDDDSVPQSNAPKVRGYPEPVRTRPNLFEPRLQVPVHRISYPFRQARILYHSLLPKTRLLAIQAFHFAGRVTTKHQPCSSNCPECFFSGQQLATSFQCDHIVSAAFLCRPHQGILGGRISDEHIPRAWIILSPAGAALDDNVESLYQKVRFWVRQNTPKNWTEPDFGSTRPGAKPVAKQPAKQPASKQPAPAGTTSAPSPPNPPTASPSQQMVDVAALLSRIAQLEHEQALRAAQPIELPPKAPAPTLFASPEEVERARAAIVEAKKDEPKVSLPNVVPGFKANPLDTGENHYLVLSQIYEARAMRTKEAVFRVLGPTLNPSTQRQLRIQAHSL